MPDVGALLVGRGTPVSDRMYLERGETKEPLLEEYLRAWIAHWPIRGAARRRQLAFVRTVNDHESALGSMDDEALRRSFCDACRTMRRVGLADGPVAVAFAAIREAARRKLGLRHHDVQLRGGWTLLKGRVAEMATGEGKTLVATLPACTVAATGAAVHIVTVNDYLAARDADVNRPVYEFLGLTVGVIQQGMEPAARREQYARDVVYVSNKEVVFDYLKDRIAAAGTTAAQSALRRLYRPAREPVLLLRGLHMAIVDEADSVLVDEARTPLIISGQGGDDAPSERFAQALEVARQLTLGQHFSISDSREALLTAAGENLVRERAAPLEGVWAAAPWRNELVRKALAALHCFERDRHYIVADDKVQIVDEFTGRVMPDRSWEQGLHQMIEVKEGCTPTDPRKTLARMTYQRFFRHYLLLAGMTGTAHEIAPELRRVYDLVVTRIPTHKPVRRQRLPDLCWCDSEQRWQAVAERALELSKEGKAVLVGTRSVQASERLSALLAERGVEHAVLNARQDKAEAQTIELAGQAGRITVATNMAGRGTDIRPMPAALAAGGLHVILTEFHESGRIDRQLLGRSARQGEPGVVQAMVSLEDELFVRHAPLALRALCQRAAIPGGLVPHGLLQALRLTAQTRAERQNRANRAQTLRADRRLNEMLGFAGAAR
jgi:preprotein translocase subunit SecA